MGGAMVCLIALVFASDSGAASGNGLARFYKNYTAYRLKITGGVAAGTYRIKYVRASKGWMVVGYAYKDGELRGSPQPNGSYSGTYRTSSSKGPFDLSFSSDGTADGSWSTKVFGVKVGGSLRIVKR